MLSFVAPSAGFAVSPPIGLARAVQARPVMMSAADGM